MKIFETTDLDEDDKIKSSATTKSMVKVCVNGLLMSKAGIGDKFSTSRVEWTPILWLVAVIWLWSGQLTIILIPTILD